MTLYKEKNKNIRIVATAISRPSVISCILEVIAPPASMLMSPLLGSGHKPDSDVSRNESSPTV